MPDTTERILDLKLAKLFRVRTVLAVLGPSVQFSVLNPVEVRSGSARLGWASVYVEKNCQCEQMVFADLVFSYATPERLSIETRSERLYGRIEGFFALSSEPWDGVRVIEPEILARLDLTQVDVLGIEIRREAAFQGQPSLGEVVL